MAAVGGGSGRGPVQSRSYARRGRRGGTDLRSAGRSADLDRSPQQQRSPPSERGRVQHDPGCGQRPDPDRDRSGGGSGDGRRDGNRTQYRPLHDRAHSDSAGFAGGAGRQRRVRGPEHESLRERHMRRSDRVRHSHRQSGRVRLPFRQQCRDTGRNGHPLRCIRSGDRAHRVRCRRLLCRERGAERGRVPDRSAAARRLFIPFRSQGVPRFGPQRGCRSLLRSCVYDNGRFQRHRHSARSGRFIGPAPRKIGR